MEIRLARPEDSAGLLAIYGQYIHTPITFECQLPSKTEFAQRIQEIGAQYPYLVCQQGGRLVGYAYAHRQMARQAYQWNAELSVYLDQANTGQGLGKRLYGLLIDILARQGVKTVYGGVTLPNAPSERLHESLGFRQLGVYRNTGYKCGAWHDVAWYEKQIAPYQPSPQPVLPITALDAAALLQEEKGRL